MRKLVGVRGWFVKGASTDVKIPIYVKRARKVVLCKSGSMLVYQKAKGERKTKDIKKGH